MNEEITVTNTNTDTPAYIAPTSFSEQEMELFGGTGPSFLPRFSLCTDRSAKVMNGEFPKNHFAFIKGQSYMDLGESADIFFLSARPKAMRISEDTIDVCYDPKIVKTPEGKNAITGLFKEIIDQSLEKDSGCMWGTEFLIWIPKISEFASFFFGSITLRNSVKDAYRYMQRFCTTVPVLIKTKRPYYSTELRPCLNVLAFPPADLANAEIARFKNPPETTKEVPDAAEKEATSRPQ
jgi:hypothetical protein